MPGAPILLRCPLCERPVTKIEQGRDYGKQCQTVTVFHHGGDWCFVVDDMRAWATPSKYTPFAITKVEASHVSA